MSWRVLRDSILESLEATAAIFFIAVGAVMLTRFMVFSGVPDVLADLVRAAVSGWLGTALEFMDFQLYSLAAALVFSQLFFSGESAGMAVVLSMATYGVGYIARPLGAVFFKGKV